MRRGTKVAPLVLALIGLANVSSFHAAQGSGAPKPPPVTHWMITVAPPEVCLLDDSSPVLVEICSLEPWPGCVVVSASNRFDSEGRCLVYCNYHCE